MEMQVCDSNDKLIWHVGVSITPANYNKLSYLLRISPRMPLICHDVRFIFQL